MTPDAATYPGHRFPGEIISHAVWLYHVFSLSLRDVELILAERGITVTHESIRQWGLKFGGDFARKLRRRRPRPGDTWHMDEGERQMQRFKSSDAAVQVARAGTALLLDARDDLRPLPSAATPDDRRSVPPRPRQSLPGVAAGDLRA